MKHKIAGSKLVNLTLVMLLSAACATAQPETTLAPPTTTPALPTSTTAPPTEMTAPTATSTLPPTATTEPTPSATITPIEAPELNPSPRGYVSIAYDSESDKVILFGGVIPGGPPYKFNDETWAYDVASNTWTNLRPASGPSLRGAVDLVYDSNSDRIILFGGSTGATLQTALVLYDTWAYDFNTNTWTEMAKGPGDHLGYRMAYDAESDRCILFGGMGYPSFKMYNDTWAYDFNSDTWTEMQPSTSPPGRNYHAMAYDAQADRVILFGGSDPQDKGIRDTWAYDFNTNTWQELERGEGESPSGRFYHTLTYNTGADRTILFGGSWGGNETWSYDYSTNTWTKLDPAENPGRRTRHAMVYSTASDRAILFGGGPAHLDYTDDTWAYDYNTNTWTDLTRRP